MNCWSSFHSSKYSRLTDERQQTAVRSAEDLRAEIRAVDLEALLGQPRGERTVRRVREDEVRFTRVHAHLEHALPEVARRDGRHDLARRRVDQGPRVVVGVVAHGRFDLLHEGVRDVDAVVKVQGLHVLVARGLSHLDERDDVGVRDVEKRRVGTAAGRALTVGERRRVVDLQVRHHAHALFVRAADRDVDADAAPQHREAVHFIQRLEEPFGRVRHVREEARDRKTALGAPEGEDRRRKREPLAGGVVVDALRVRFVGGELLRDEGEALLRTRLVRAHVAFLETHHGELAEEAVAGGIGLDGHGCSGPGGVAGI